MSTIAHGPLHLGGFPLLLAVIAIMQAAFLVVLVGFLIANRGRRRARAHRQLVVSSESAVPLHRWLIGRGQVEDVAAYLRRLSPELALEQIANVATLRVPSDQLRALAGVLRHEAWVARALRGVRSPLWWHRLGAARALAVVGGPADRDLVGILLRDPHPAVALAATSCLAAVPDSGLIAQVIDDLPRRALAVRAYAFAALREVWQLAMPPLLERLRPDAPPDHLEVWINLADAIGAPDGIARAATLRSHPSADVRLAVAKALKKYVHPDAVPALLALLADPDWRIRGQAARGIGALAAVGAAGAVAPLTRALGDPAWWVRYRAALSLAQLGEPGRGALRAARGSADRFVSDMATMVGGLSEGGVAELADV